MINLISSKIKNMIKKYELVCALIKQSQTMSENSLL